MPSFGPWPQQPPTNHPGNSGPVYVVYLGKGNASGFYHHYDSADDCVGADSIAPPNFHGRLIKSFPTVQAGRSVYKECFQTGILGLLAEPVTKSMVYIVTKGFEPGVYTTKKAMLSHGLNWRGGEATCTEGTVAQATAIFELWRALGHVNRLRWDRKFILDDFCNEEDHKYIDFR
ncbi:hypothetical protein BT96DRAFT_840543 [Gymnopus androsaceus JB14]|uniref:Uncharacterized protein n=1 Tax=Gymnopus androsaceus JB14 TaxID=1447944 RepID=A0A6A4GJS0_9AGAR|nr:hypothetical protein BT96DRAFT_840543 [Gymnopus androsaceus JB14]